ncbi:MAG TPA: NAD-binding protein, partial [Candidatus Eisenbacteria bacterium]|nr:NAD-binding protein [Candidatus Eisenbacteria bacterium]
MRIVIVGTGYVGLVTGAGFADFGNEVLCVDADRSKIEILERG